jgi:hypothetical protein
MPVDTPKPPKKKGEPPSRKEAKGNLEKSEPSRTVALNFRVPASLKKDFKVSAATAEITQSELLAQAFQLWKERHG